MLKLYKQITGKLHYHEAWVKGNAVYEHWGLVGERGKTKIHALQSGNDVNDAILAVLASAAEAGYRSINASDHITLVIEYTISGMGTPEDLIKRHAVEEHMSDVLGWTGLGDCDGGSTGSDSMEIRCFVVDFDIAKRVVRADLRETQFSDFNCIYNEDESH